MEIAGIMAIILANGGGKPPVWQDFVVLLINSTISFIENNVSNVVAVLMAGLTPKTKSVERPEMVGTGSYNSCPR